MRGLKWIQVLEIETYLNKVMHENAMFFQVRIWEEGKKHNLILNQTQLYTSEDIKEYLFNKYPQNQFFRDAQELIGQLYNNLIMGNRICKVDENLYSLNSNPEPFQTTGREQRLKFLEAFNQRTGVDIYWYNILKEIVQKQEQYDTKKISDEFLSVAESNLKTEVGISIYDLDKEIISQNMGVIDNINSVKIQLLSKFDIIKDRILDYEKSTNYKVFQKMCADNGYTFFYENVKPSQVLKDSIAFSINLCLTRLNSDSRNLFDYELRKSTSLYPQDLMKNPVNTLIFYITPYGFSKFDTITNLFKSGKLEKAAKNILAEEFEILDVTAIVDNEDWISEWNRLNSSFIVGRDLKYRTFWGRRTKTFVDKLITGTFWFNDDVHGTNLGFIGLHPDTAYEGEQKHSMPAKNVLYYYSELRLEKTQWERGLNEIYEAGYRDYPEDDVENEEEYFDEF